MHCLKTATCYRSPLSCLLATYTLPLCLLLTACAKTRPAAAISGPVTSARISADTATRYRPGLVSTPEHDEGGLLLTGFGDSRTAPRETYFWRRLPGEKQKIYVLDGPDDASPRLASFSTDRDENPYLTRDGLTGYFGSERPIPGRPNLGNFDMNLWVTRRTSVTRPWSDPEPLPPSFNQVQREGEEWPLGNVSAVASLDDETFYVSTQNRGDTATRLYAYRRDATDNLVDPRPVDGLFADPRFAVGGPALTPDGRYLFFSSYGAPGGEGGEDLYVSRRTSAGGWSRAVALARVNSVHEEAGPYVSPDGETLYFGKCYLLDREAYAYTPWDVFAVPVGSLGLEALFE